MSPQPAVRGQRHPCVSATHTGTGGYLATPSFPATRRAEQFQAKYQLSALVVALTSILFFFVHPLLKVVRAPLLCLPAPSAKRDRAVRAVQFSYLPTAVPAALVAFSGVGSLLDGLVAARKTYTKRVSDALVTRLRNCPGAVRARRRSTWSLL